MHLILIATIVMLCSASVIGEFTYFSLQLVLPLAQLGSACSVIRALASQHLPSTHQRVNQAIIVTAAAERPVTLNDVTETVHA